MAGAAERREGKREGFCEMGAWPGRHLWIERPDPQLFFGTADWTKRSAGHYAPGILLRFHGTGHPLASRVPAHQPRPRALPAGDDTRRDSGKSAFWNRRR